MRCRSCGRVMQDGLSKCPHCGSIVHVGGLPSDEFTWNVPEYKKPEPRKKVQMDINWQNGQIIEKDTGRVYSQSSSWSDSIDTGTREPEFSFELNSDRKTQKVKKFDSSSDSMYQGRISSIEESPFTIPSELDMNNVSYQSQKTKSSYQPERKEPEQVSWFPDFDIGPSSKPVQKKPAQKKPVQKKRVEQSPRTQTREIRRPEKNTDDHLFFGVSQRSEDVELDWSFVDQAEREQKVVKKIDSAQQKKMKAKGLGKAASGVYSAPEQMQVQQYDPFEKQHKIKNIKIPRFISEGKGVSIFPEISKINIENGADEFDTAIGFAVAANEIDAKAAGAFHKLLGIEQRFTEELEKIVYMSEEEVIEERRVQRRREQLIDVPEITYRTIEDEFDKYCSENGIEKATEIPETSAEKADEAKEKKVSDEEKESVSERSGEEEVKSEPGVKIQAKTRIVDIEAVNGTETSDADKEKEASDPEGEEGIFWERNNNASRLTITDIFGPEARKLMEDSEDGDEEEKAEETAEGTVDEAADVDGSSEQEENAASEEAEEAVSASAEEAVSGSDEETAEEAAGETAEEAAGEKAEEEAPADNSTVRLEPEELRNLTDESASEGTVSSDADAEAERFEEMEEYVYVVNEERPTKQEILNMTSEEMEQKAAEKAEEAKKASEQEKSKKAEKKADKKAEKKAADPEKSKKSEDSEKSKKTKKKLKKPKMKVKKPAKKTEKPAKKKKVKEPKAERDPKNKIYIIIIAILAIAIFLEFFIFAVKVMNPDSLAGNIIRGIESIFKGSILPGSGGKLL